MIRLAALLLLFTGISAAAEIDIEGPPPKSLSSWGLFQGGGASQVPSPGVIAYDINTQLFSDYAIKHRFVRLPEGKTSRYNAVDAFDFPIGTVLVKTFAYYHDFRSPDKGERLLETRLLVRKKAGWIGYPYVWNDAQNKAVLKVAGAALDGVSWIHGDGKKRSVRYLVPNMNQCKSCHATKGRGTMGPLGLTARNLNRMHADSRGKTMNQLKRWMAEGILENAPPLKEIPRLPVWNNSRTGSVAKRARAYLEVNCANCHNPKGPADTAGVDWTFTQTDPLKVGIGKSPVAAGRGSGGFSHDIKPGHPDESILIYRMQSTTPGEMMPELGRRLVHIEAVALLRDWIAGMKTP